MSFKYPLLASVVLVTSAPLVIQDLEDEAAPPEQEGDEALVAGVLRCGAIEEGQIIARMEYADGSPPHYTVRYRDGNNCQAEGFWSEQALTTRDEIREQWLAEHEAPAGGYDDAEAAAPAG